MLRNLALGPLLDSQLGHHARRAGLALSSDAMSFLDDLQSDLRRAQVEHQATLLVQVLRNRLQDLTFGELRQILNSRLGQSLTTRAVRDLVVDAGAVPAEATMSKPPGGAVTKSARARKKTKVAAQKPPGKGAKRGPRRRVATGTTQPPPGAPSTPPKVSALSVAGREQYDAAVLQFLRKQGGLQAAGFVRAHTGGSDGQIRGAMERLEKAGLVERSGKFASTRYQART